MSIYDYDEEQHERALREHVQEELIQLELSKGMITPKQAEELRKESKLVTT